MLQHLQQGYTDCLVICCVFMLNMKIGVKIFSIIENHFLKAFFKTITHTTKTSKRFVFSGLN